MLVVVYKLSPFIYFLYIIDLRASVGQRIGFGIHYNPEDYASPNFDDRKQQLVLCFVTLDMKIVYFSMMMQPPGGFYPLIILTRGGTVL